MSDVVIRAKSRIPSVFLASSLLILMPIVVVAEDAAPADVAISVTVRDLAFGQRIDYVLGDGQHPFVDEDNRRALLGFDARANGRVAVLGFSALAFTECVSDSGEALDPTLPLTVGGTVDHERKADPVIALFTVGMPIGKHPYAGIARLRGTVEVQYASGDPERWDVTFAALKAGDTSGDKASDDCAIGGHEDLTLAVADPADPSPGGQLALRVSPQARLAVVDLEFRDGAGKPIAIKSKRPDRRDAKPGKRKRQPVGGKDDVLIYAVTLPDDASVTVRYYPTIERRTVPIAIDALPFGLTLSGHDGVRGEPPRGADDL